MGSSGGGEDRGRTETPTAHVVIHREIKRQSCVWHPKPWVSWSNREGWKVWSGGTFFAFVSFQSAFWRKKIHFKYNAIQIQVFKLLFFSWKIYLEGKKTMTSIGTRFTVTCEMFTTVACDQRWPDVVTEISVHFSKFAFVLFCHITNHLTLSLPRVT